MSKLERLLNLTAVLLDTDRPLAADDLRMQVEGYPESDMAFRRAFERDKDDLRTLGIPLRTMRVPATDPPLDGYRIPPEEYYLPDPGLDPEELAALHLASLTVRLDGLGDSESRAGHEALWKLGGLSQATVNSPEASLVDLPGDLALVPVFQAIAAKRAVRFTYRGELRTVDPWRLSFQRGRWYLSGYDHARGGERNFRIGRFDGDVVIAEDLEFNDPEPSRDSGRTLSPWEIGEDEATMVALLVDADHAELAARQLGPGIEANDHPGGGVTFSIPVVNLAAFRSFVLGFLEHAEILEPPEVRADLVAWLERVPS